MADGYQQLAGWLAGRTEAERQLLLASYLFCQLHQGIIRADLRDLAIFCTAPDAAGQFRPLAKTIALLDRLVRPLLVPHPEQPGALTFSAVYLELAAAQQADAKRDAIRARWRRVKQTQRARLKSVRADTPEDVRADVHPVRADIRAGAPCQAEQPQPAKQLALAWSEPVVHADTPPARACNTNSKISSSACNSAAAPVAAFGSQTTKRKDFQPRGLDDKALSARQRLATYGMARRTLHRLVERYGPDRCLEQADFLAWKLEQPQHQIDNPAGYLRKAIEVGYRRPAGYVSQAEREASRQERERRRAERARQNDEQDIRKRARAAFYHDLAKQWGRLPEAERLAVVRRIESPDAHLAGSIESYDALAEQLEIPHPDDLPLAEARTWAQRARAPTVALSHQGRSEPNDTSQGGHHGKAARAAGVCTG